MMIHGIYLITMSNTELEITSNSKSYNISIVTSCCLSIWFCSNSKYHIIYSCILFRIICLVYSMFCTSINYFSCSKISIWYKWSIAWVISICSRRELIAINHAIRSSIIDNNTRVCLINKSSFCRTSRYNDSIRSICTDFDIETSWLILKRVECSEINNCRRKFHIQKWKHLCLYLDSSNATTCCSRWECFIPHNRAIKCSCTCNASSTNLSSCMRHKSDSAYCCKSTSCYEDIMYICFCHIRVC